LPQIFIKKHETDMKKLLLMTLLLVCGITMATAQKQAEIKFEKTTHDFGTFSEKSPVVTCTFTFSNVGEKPLVINQAMASCGCTVPEYDRAPVKPGATGTIRVRFDSDNKEGAQYKTIKVTSNCKDNIFELVLKGTVKAE
jgi:hypothetical protein